MPNKRVFSKSLNASCLAGSMEAWAGGHFIHWLMEEPIDIIGASIVVDNCGIPSIDGQYLWKATLSQVADKTSDGKILMCTGGQFFKNVATAQELGWSAGGSGRADLILPYGHAIKVKEEGYVHFMLQGTTPVGDTLWALEGYASIFYTKG